MTGGKYVPPHLRNKSAEDKEKDEEKDDAPRDDDQREKGRRKGDGKGKKGGYKSQDGEDGGSRFGDRGGYRNDRDRGGPRDRDDRDDRFGRDDRGGKGSGKDNDRDDHRDEDKPSRFDCLREDDEPPQQQRRGKGGDKGEGSSFRGGGRGEWKGENKDLRDRNRVNEGASLDWNKRQDGRRGDGDLTEIEVFGEKKDRSSAGIDFDSYSKIPVEVSGNNTESLRPIERFSEARLTESLFENLQRCGYDRPTPIQKHAIPIVVSGRDLMGCAQTGSGKTCAFMVPCIESLLRSGPPASSNSNRRSGPQPCGLVLAPTRELASQIHAESLKFAFNTGIRCCIVYGGADMREQRRELGNGCDILIATPGRLTDMYERGNVSLAVISFFILDEADRMLDMGFEPQVRQIVEKTDMGRGLRSQRQSMMFSATFPREVQFMARDFLTDYVFITIGRVGSASELIAQKVVYAEDGPQKVRALERTLKEYMKEKQDGDTQDRLTVIFVETKRGADSLERDLWQAGVAVTAIHGDRSQADREAALDAFRTGQNPILVATDVAARGLDIPNVALVVNFDMPKQLDDYVHRIGRTGRAGRKGTAISFVNERCAFLSQLLDLLTEAKQELPVWFEDLCKQRRWGGGGKGRTAERFGGRDLRATDETLKQSTQSTSEKPKRHAVEVRRDAAPKKDDAWGNTGVEDAWSD